MRKPANKRGLPSLPDIKQAYYKDFMAFISRLLEKRKKTNDEDDFREENRVAWMATALVVTMIQPDLTVKRLTGMLKYLGASNLDIVEFMSLVNERKRFVDFERTRSSTGLEHSVDNREVVGSSPTGSTESL